MTFAGEAGRNRNDAEGDSAQAEGGRPGEARGASARAARYEALCHRLETTPIEISSITNS